MSQELERFIVMFDGLVNLSNKWIEATPKDKLDWVPQEGAGVQFGDRLSQVTIKKLYGHISLSEYSRIHTLRDCPEGAVLGMNKDPDVVARLESDDFLAEARKLHEQCMDIARGYTDRELTKKIIHTECTYTGMGFLWAMYAHHAYHLGNIDIYLRLASGTAPDFFRFNRQEMA